MTTTPASTTPTLLSLAHVASKPLTWLWPDRIPLGHLTLLDAAPGCGLSLFALTLAASITRGTPLPDGTRAPQSTVLLIAPYDTPEDTILPRFQAAGGDTTRIVLYRPLIQETPQTTVRSRDLMLPHDLDHLTSTIRQHDIRLVIIDPASSISGLNRCLPALINLAREANCAIVLTRSLSRAPADPLHPRCPASPILTAARSHLLLTPDPSDDRHCLLLTPKHSLCAAPSILAYTITSTEQGIPIIHWLPAPDPTYLHRLCTGPIRSPHRQAILHFLRECPNPCHIKDILHATSYDYEAGRKMLVRMKMAGELVSLDRGLYTTSNHPCLSNITNNSQPGSTTSPVPVPNVPADSSTSSEQSGTSVGPSAERSAARFNPSRPSPQRSEAERVSILRLSGESTTSLHHQPSVRLDDSQTDLFNRTITSGEEALVQIQAGLAASGYPIPTIPMSHVPNPNSTTNSHNSPSTERSDDKEAQSFIPLGTGAPYPKK